jgi:predicted DNA-binding protein
MERKTKHFDMRLKPSVNRALEILAKQKGVTKTDYLVGYIERQAKAKGVKCG